MNYKKYYLVSILFISFMSFAAAQGTLEYTMKVVDESGQPKPGVKVVMEETSSQDKEESITDNKGEAHFVLNYGKTWWIHVGKMQKLTSVEVPSEGVTRGRQTVPYVPEMMVSRDNLPDRSTISLTTIDQSQERYTQATGQNAWVKIKLVDRNGLVVRNTPIAMTCLESKTRYTSKTDARGLAAFMVPVGQLYHIDVDKVNYYQKVDLPKSYAGFETTIKVHYQPTQVVEQNLQDTIVQQVPKSAKSSAERAYVSIKARDKTGQMLANEPVYIREIGTKKVYLVRTDQNGEARFLLPLNSRYLVSFEYQPDVDYIDLRQTYGRVNKIEYVLTYEPIPRLANPEQFIPTPDQIFLEEFQHFINRQWANPRNNRLVDVKLQWGNNAINGSSKEAVLDVQIVTPTEVPAQYQRQPVNVVFVLDKSGSMAGYERMDSLKAALQYFSKLLNPNDQVALVAFNGEAELLMSSRPMGNGDFFREAVAAIEPEGSTNIYKGLQMGYAELQTGFSADRQNRIVLLSDGYGSTEPKTVIDEVKGYVEKGVEISAIGVGEHYNYALMSQLASLGGGLLHYVGDAKNMRETFGAEMGSLLMPLAHDLSLELVYNDRVVFQQLYGHPFEHDEPIAKMQIDNVYAGMRKLALVSFALPKPKPSIERFPVVVRYSYTNNFTGKRETFQEEAVLQWSDYTGKMQLIRDHEQKKLFAIAIMNQSIKNMADAFANEHYAEARKAITDCLKQIEELYPDAEDEDVRELHQQLMTYARALEQKMKNTRKEQEQKGNNMK